MKKLVLLVLALVSLGYAQNPLILEQTDSGAVATGTVIRFNANSVRGARRFEYVYGGVVSTVSTVLKGCMRGADTCDTLETSTSTSSNTRCITDNYDYFTITPTFTGGTSPTLNVFMTTGVGLACPGLQTAHGVNTTGTTASNIPLAELDDTSTSACTENQFCALRVGGVSRALLIGGSNAPTAASSTVLPIAVSGFGAVATGHAVTPANGASITSNVVAPISSAGTSVGSLTGGFIVLPRVFNGGTLDMISSADLTNDEVSTTLTGRNSIGALQVEKGSRWTVIHNPAANSQATASIASEASVRHVVDCVSFSAGAVVAPALTALTINVRDGASGAGTIIWTYQVIIPAATGQSVAPHSICGLNLVGTTATAMTLEFSAGLTSLVESVSISGYNVN